MKSALCLASFALLIPVAHADQGAFTNSGGSLGGTVVADPAGTLSIAGTTLSFLSDDGTTTIEATLSDSSTVENCQGGGIGGHIVCTFTLTSTFSGTLTVNGAAQAINGFTTQVYGTDGVVLGGSTGYNSAYTPFYFSNSAQILRSDDLNGTNLVSYGTQGSGTGEFYGANGIALDSSGRIYVADTYNGRVVRIDDMNGTNWTSFGSWGSGVGQFKDLSGISIDPAGRIYVMDAGNSRLVRIDDMNGANWTTLSAIGSGVGQLASYDAPVAFDASGRIYVADAGNKRIVRMDDLNGANWTTLTQFHASNGSTYSFQSPVGVAVDPEGRIDVVDTWPLQPVAIRVGDMTGANGSYIYLGSGSTPHSISVDASGMVLVGGGGAQIVDDEQVVLMSSSALTQFFGPYYVFGATLLPHPPGGLPTWTNLGHAKSGSHGTPALSGTGLLSAGSSNVLRVSGAKASSMATLVFGITQLNAPFKGGLLVPTPLLTMPLPTDGLGKLVLPFVLPPGLPSAFPLDFQFWIQDAGASFGLSASNALSGLTL